MPLITDLRELKGMLEIDPANTQEDRNLLLYVEQASGWIEEWLGRPKQLFQRSRTQFYAGSGTQKLLLKARPVLIAPAIQCFVDEGGYYGAASGSFTDGSGQTANDTLVYGVDFALRLDTDLNDDGVDDASRCGILVRMNALWPKPTIRQVGYLTPFVGEAFGTVKVVYTGGYTVDQLPAQLRQACNLLVARMRYVFPLGLDLTSESYEERSISIGSHEKGYMMALVAPLLTAYRNWKW